MQGDLSAPVDKAVILRSAFFISLHNTPEFVVYLQFRDVVRGVFSGVLQPVDSFLIDHVFDLMIFDFERGEEWIHFLYNFSKKLIQFEQQLFHSLFFFGG